MKGKFVPIPQNLICNECGFFALVTRTHNIQSITCVNKECSNFEKYFALDILELEEITL